MNVTKKRPYLRQRSNGSFEYFRPVSRKLAPYFDGYLNKNGTAIYRVFRVGGKPDKDERDVIPVYLRFHAEIEERKRDAEAGRLITPSIVAELKALSEKWLTWTFPGSPPNALVARPPRHPRPGVALEDLAEELRRAGAIVEVHHATQATDRHKLIKVLEDKEDLRMSLAYFLKRRGFTLSDRETAELANLAAAAYRAKFPYLPLRESSDEFVPAKLPAQIETTKALNVPGRTLGDMLDRWREDKNPSTKAFSERRRSVRQFDETVGELAVEQITKDHVRQFKDALRRLPESRKIPLNLRALFHGQSVPQLVKLMERNPQVQKQTPANATKTIGNISALLTLAVDEGFIENNPALGMKLSDPDKPLRKRRAYDDTDLARIFGSERIDQSGISPAQRDEWFWLPLLGMLTGARLEELGQLWVADVQRREDGIYIDINGAGDAQNPKYIKSTQSKREIPLRHELIRAGFMIYVAARRKGGSVRLFPKLKYDRSSRKYTKAFSSDWSDFVHHKLGVSERKVFHSFRHAFVDATRAARLPEYVNRALVGHTGRNDPHDSYGEGARVSVIDVEKLIFTKVDLDRFFVQDAA